MDNNYTTKSTVNNFKELYSDRSDLYSPDTICVTTAVLLEKQFAAISSKYATSSSGTSQIKLACIVLSIILFNRPIFPQNASGEARSLEGLTKKNYYGLLVDDFYRLDTIPDP